MLITAVRSIRSPLRIIALASAGLAAVAVPTGAQAQSALTPPTGNARFLSTTGVGTQNYVCLPTAADPQRSSWVLVGPQSGLSVPFFGTRTLEVAENISSAVPGTATTPSPGCVEAANGVQQYCPTFRSPYDLSAVWASPVAKVAAGSSAACPNAGSIPCLLLKTLATSGGQFAPNLFGKTTYIQRLMTQGGSAPAGTCRVGQLQQVPYKATYDFYAAH